MTTIPIGVLIFAIVAAAAMGVLVCKAADWNRVKYLQAARDDLRYQLDKMREQRDETTKRLRECEAIQAKIRGLLPEAPEISVTCTRS